MSHKKGWLVYEYNKYEGISHVEPHVYLDNDKAELAKAKYESKLIKEFIEHMDKMKRHFKQNPIDENPGVDITELRHDFADIMEVVIIE